MQMSRAETPAWATPAAPGKSVQAAAAKNGSSVMHASISTHIQLGACHASACARQAFLIMAQSKTTRL